MGHITQLGLSAEHGCFIRQPGTEDWEKPDVEDGHGLAEGGHGRLRTLHGAHAGVLDREEARRADLALPASGSGLWCLAGDRGAEDVGGRHTEEVGRRGHERES